MLCVTIISFDISEHKLMNYFVVRMKLREGGA